MFHRDQLALVASGSIASVFYALWHEGGGVALKLQRPGIARLMMADLSLLEGMVRLAERLPKCEGMPLGDLMAYVSKAILGQLDFSREAENLARLRKGLSAIPALRVPAVVEEASVPGCLVMEFIPGLDAHNAEMHSPGTRRRLAMTALQAVRQMIFVEGFVHCDLHPGNLYVTREGEVVILDAGFSAQLPDRVRRLISEFFAALFRGNGRRCAEIIIESAVRIQPGTDLESFIGAVAALVERQAGPGAGAFAMMDFGNSLFDLQREYGLYAESDFVFPLMSLAVIESTVRGLSPDLDFKELGRMAGVQRNWDEQSQREGTRELVQ
jgi:ubiquinone biosynthesis protein